jgi:glycosyltransferase involved in cell wall biosynthesis
VQGDDLLTWYRRASIVTNLSPPGLFDKAALEAMFMARPVLAANPAFDEVLGDQSALLRLTNNAGPTEVAERLSVLLARSAAERALIGAALRERAVRAYSLDQLMDRLVALWTE